MSDPNSYSARKSANNDGMCPDWRPEPDEEWKFIKRMKDLYYIASYFADISEKFSDEELKGKTFKMSVVGEKTIELRDCVKNLKEII